MDLINNRHCNKYMQSDFIKYGYSGFTFEILEICSEFEMNNLEKEYIRNLELGDYNIAGLKLENKTLVGDILPTKATPQDSVLVFNISNFINDNFKPDKQIDINAIKNKFQLSRRQWDTIRTKLNNIEVRGKKTYRLG